jgi:hypothetical protein
MHVKSLLVCRCFIYQLNKVATCFKEINIRENRAEKYSLNFSLELVKGDYEFLAFKRPLVDNECDMPAQEHTLFAQWQNMKMCTKISMLQPRG